jgi:hypothetical protein
MGWWSASILGGDTPYDAHAWAWNTVLRLSGKDLTYETYLDSEASPFDHDNDLLRECLTEEVMTVALEELENDKNHTDKDVYSQVLALMILEAGVLFPEQLKDRFIQLIAKDEWADYDHERAVYVLDLIRRVTSNLGVVQELPRQGLFEKMSCYFNNSTSRDPIEDISLTKEDSDNAQVILRGIINDTPAQCC